MCICTCAVYRAVSESLRVSNILHDKPTNTPTKITGGFTSDYAAHNNKENGGLETTPVIAPRPQCLSYNHPQL